MKEQNPLQPYRRAKLMWLWLATGVAWVNFGIHLLFYFKGDWFPIWVQVTLLIGTVFLLIVFLYLSMRNASPFSLREFNFKPYWLACMLCGGIVMTILGWVVALIIYTTMWFIIAMSITLLMIVSCWIGIRHAVEQSESSDVV